MGIELRLGAKVDGKYEVIKKIGEGGFGVVYHVKQIADGAEFALKISDTFGVDDDIVKRMRREIRLMQKMNHPNVISVLDFGEGNDSIYLVMPLAKHAVSKEIKALAANPQQALQVFEEACIGVEALHQAGIYHRDIKPGNMLRLMDGTIAVSDLGCGRFAERDTSTVTSTNARQGTPAYRAPEQSTPGGAKDEDHRTDVFLLGRTLYHLLTDALP